MKLLISQKAMPSNIMDNVALSIRASDQKNSHMGHFGRQWQRTSMGRGKLTKEKRG